MIAPDRLLDRREPRFSLGVAMAKTQKSAAKPSARKKRILTVKKETIKDLAAPSRGRDVKGGTD